MTRTIAGALELVRRLGVDAGAALAQRAADALAARGYASCDAATAQRLATTPHASSTTPTATWPPRTPELARSRADHANVSGLLAVALADARKSTAAADRAAALDGPAPEGVEITTRIQRVIWSASRSVPSLQHDFLPERACRELAFVLAPMVAGWIEAARTPEVDPT